MGALQKIAPDKPQVYNGIEVSYGIAPILSTLSNLSTRMNRPQWTLYLINVETIIRDRKDQRSNERSVAEDVLRDCSVLAQYISAYSTHTLPPQMKTKPLVCFYLPHYEGIPKIHLRDKLPKGTEDRWEVRDEIEKLLKAEGYQDHYESTRVAYSIVGNDGWAHKELLKELVGIHSDIRYRKTLMVSHVPLDFHLYRTFNDFNILESYTGTIKNPKLFGKKVFGDEAFPFNKYTHLLLGDKWYLKSLITPAAKKQLKERAIREHWSLMPDKEVLRSLIKANVALPDLYVKPEI